MCVTSCFVFSRPFYPYYSDPFGINKEELKKGLPISWFYGNTIANEKEGPFLEVTTWPTVFQRLSHTER